MRMSQNIYTIDEIRDIAAPIAAAHGVDRLWLFGSYARGEATAQSDIDLCVDCGRIRTLFQLGGLYEDLREGFDKELDMITTGHSDKAFLQRIQPEQVVLYARQ